MGMWDECCLHQGDPATQHRANTPPLDSHKYCNSLLEANGLVMHSTKLCFYTSDMQTFSGAAEPHSAQA